MNPNDPNNPNPPVGGSIQPDLSSTLSNPPNPSPPPATEPSLNPPPSTPLDNPLNAPPAPPPIDAGVSIPPISTPPMPEPELNQPTAPEPPQPQPVPTFTTPQEQTVPPASNFSWPSSPAGETNPVFSPESLAPSEPAPTDLSHLVDPNSQGVPVYTPPISQPETLVAPPTSDNTSEVPNIPTEGSGGGIPKWVIGLGLGLLLAVVGASAYFILGIGKTPQPQSTPATTTAPPQQLTTPPVNTRTSPSATGSAGFEELGTSPTPAATSAADLLKQRQGR